MRPSLGRCVRLAWSQMTESVDPEKRRELLSKLSEQLEATQAVTEELGEGMAWLFGRSRSR